MSIFILFYFYFLYFLLATCSRWPSQTSPNLPGRWQIGCDRKVKLLGPYAWRRSKC